MRPKPSAPTRPWVWKSGRDASQLRTLGTQVRIAAQAQAQQLRPINLERALRRFRTVARKACGPDEWTADMLRALNPEAGTLLVEEMMQWEREGVLPDQLTIVRYTLLPKSAEDERPIGLTSYLYRSYCRLRWDLYAQWLEEYRRSAPWDRALPGHSSLDTALARTARHEVCKHTRKHGVTALVDLSSFYELVPHSILLREGLEKEFPPVLLNAARFTAETGS